MNSDMWNTVLAIFVYVLQITIGVEITFCLFNSLCLADSFGGLVATLSCSRCRSVWKNEYI